MHKLLPASLALALAAPLAARADTGADLQALKQEINALRADYDARIRALEQRLYAASAAQPAPTAADTATTAPTPTASAAVAVAPTAAPEAAVSTAAPAPAAGSNAAATAFNPGISLILSGLYTRTSQDPSAYRITGFPLPADAEVGPGQRGFSLAESELGFAANIDPWLSGAANIALHPDDTVSVEEAYVQTTSLGNGLGLKAGRFFSGVGYLNSQHAHVWDFVDAPLAYQAMLGGQYGDDGVRLTWLAPTDLLLELGAELGRGRSFPGSDTGRNGAGMSALTAHLGGDIGDSQSWRAGLSVLNAKATGLSLAATDAAGNDITNAFTGRTRVWVADAVWKWAPNGNAVRTNFKLQGEYLHSRRDGTLVTDVGGANTEGPLALTQSGWYVQGVYQFMPRWRVGLRTERLSPGDGVDYRPRRNALMVDFSPSEFSRVRLQLARDLAHEGAPDNQVFLQYQMSLGAHGAHSY